ncbi:MAG: hypothetical protein M2R45_00687 [Verrucomicrobia subdivision 3 bacterium]|nr:hypothetical protein [Limisphaerales bacterium]MCS1414429.1 hypothetical protein [Limisphaerales bacterium]
MLSLHIYQQQKGAYMLKIGCLYPEISDLLLDRANISLVLRLVFSIHPLAVATENTKAKNSGEKKQ